MKKMCIGIRGLLFLFITLTCIYSLYAIDSANYKIISPTVSTGADNASSTNYKLGLIFEDLTNNQSSSNYKAFLGFWYSFSSGQELKIYYVSPLPNTDPVSGGVNNIYVNFSVYSEYGYGNVNFSSIKINVSNFSRSNIVRQNTSCVVINSNGNYINYSCAVPMWFFDRNGWWGINISISDYSGNAAINDTNNFLYTQLQSWDMNSSSINWSNLAMGVINQAADKNFTLYNYGNVNTSIISINSSNLIGAADSLYNISVGNFSVDGCSAKKLIENQNVSSSLTINYTQSSFIYNASGNLSFCATGPIVGLKTQTYNSYRDWLINVDFA